MYDKLTDVPVEIRDFYMEEIRNEATGNLIDEEYTYIDENGDEQTGTRQVLEFVDNTYIVEKKHSDLKTWEDARACMVNAQGNKDSVVDYFIEKAIENDQVEYFEAYKEYLVKIAQIEEDEANYIPIEDVEEPDWDAMKDAIIKPVKPVMTLADWKLDHYDELRRAEYDGYRHQFEQQFDQIWEGEINKTKAKYPKRGGNN